MLRNSISIILGILIKRILPVVGFFIFFMYWLFPFNDLGDLVATKVAEVTGGQIFVNFDKLDLSIIPQPGLALGQVSVETPFTPPLTAKKISLAPSIAGLLSFKPGVSVIADGFLGGQLSLSTRGGDKVAATKKTKQKISLELEDVDLKDLSQLARLPVPLSGKLSGELTSQVDLDMVEQPTAQIGMSGSRVIVAQGTLSTPMGPMEMPKINLENATVEGKLEKGSLEFTKLNFGKPGSEFSAQVSGKLDLKIVKLGQNIVPQMGAYDFSVKFQINDSFKQKFGTYLPLLQSYQNTPNNYGLRISAQNAYTTPSIVKAQ